MLIGDLASLAQVKALELRIFERAFQYLDVGWVLPLTQIGVKADHKVASLVQQH